MRLDARTVARLTLPDGVDDRVFWDDELVGFGRRLRRAGDGARPSWLVQYRSKGRTRKFTWSGLLSVADARRKARILLASVVCGADPAGDRDAARLATIRTFRSTVATYLAARTPDWRPATLVAAKRFLTGDSFAVLHDVDITRIDRAAVAACITAIVAARGEGAAKKARGWASTFFAWAVSEGLLTTNPVVGTRVLKDYTARERTLSDAELRTIWGACDQPTDFDRIIRLLVLTAARREEIAGMRWSEIDMDAGVWTLPAERSKNHRALTLPLPSAAMDIIRSVPRIDARDHVFGVWGKGFTGFAAAKGKLDRRLGDAVGAWHIHDIRRTVATGLAELGVLPHIVEVVQNHHSHRAGVAGVYNKATYAAAIGAALDLWACHVTGDVAAEAPKLRVVV